MTNMTVANTNNGFAPVTGLSGGVAGVAPAGDDARIAIHAQTVKLTEMAGEQILLLKRNESSGFPGAVLRVPVISRASILEGIVSGGADGILVRLLENQVIQAQRDIARAIVLNGGASVARADVGTMEGVIGFLGSSLPGARGPAVRAFRWTKELFAAMGPAIHAAAFAFYLERKPDVAALADQSMQLSKALPTINKYLGLVGMLFAARNAKADDDAAKAQISAADCVNLTEILAMALMLVETDPDGAVDGALITAFNHVAQLVDDCAARAVSDDVL